MSPMTPPRGAPLRSISAVLPAYNEAANIGQVVDATLDALHDAVPDSEIIIVDDGSTDATPGICAELAEQYPAIRVVRHGRNAGYGAAVRSGIAAATKQYLFLMDANRRFDPAEVARLVQWGDQYDIVTGYRLHRQDPLYRAALGPLFRVAIRRIFGIKVRDVNCGFKLVRTALLKSMDLRSSTSVVNVELLYYASRQHAAVREAGVHKYRRRTTRSAGFRLRTSLRTLRELIALRRRIGQETRATAAKSER